MKTIAQQLGITEFFFEIKDKNGNKIYYEDSNGIIIDKRPKPVIELTLDQIAEKMGIDVSQIRIKD